MKKNCVNIIIAIALLAVVLIYQKINHNSKISKWPSVEGVVMNSTVIKKIRNLKMHYWPFIKYSYVVENEKYVGTYYDSISSGYLSEEAALRIINDFPEGEPILIYYNPDKPGESVIAELN